MNRTVTYPRQLIERIIKRHPELPLTIDPEKKIALGMSKSGMNAVREALNTHDHVLIRRATEGNQIPRIVPEKFYKLKLMYSLNKPQVCRKAVQHSIKSRAFHRSLVTA